MKPAVLLLWALVATLRLSSCSLLDNASSRFLSGSLTDNEKKRVKKHLNSFYKKTKKSLIGFVMVRQIYFRCNAKSSLR